MTKIKVKKKAVDWAVFSFLKAAQIWSTRLMRYSPVQADQKKPNWAATRQQPTVCSEEMYPCARARIPSVENVYLNFVI